MVTLARRLLGFTLVSTAIAVAACGGKVADDDPGATRQNGTTRPSEPFYPVDTPPSIPTAVPPQPPPPPPPPPQDAGAPLEDQLVLGGPRCPKRLPVDSAGCGPQHGSKCEYAVKSGDGGVCRWFCSCSSPYDDDFQSIWSCGFGECQ